MPDAPEPTGDGLLRHADGLVRCSWAGSDADYIDYHDHEWGVPVSDDVRLFEKLCLEGFQSGLSWLTILRKRAAFREAFAGFEPAVLARFGPDDVDRLLQDAGIVRHRGKIEAAINNAARVVELVADAGPLSDHLWSFAPAARPARPRTPAEVPVSTSHSTVLPKDLKRRGWRFVGPTTAYAFMQAMGMVDDHLEGCHVPARPRPT